MGFRTTGGAQVVVQTVREPQTFNHVSTLSGVQLVGFDWGRAGSGQAQLALALLAHVTADDAFALEHYQVFQHEIIARFPKHRFEPTLELIQADGQEQIPYEHLQTLEAEDEPSSRTF